MISETPELINYYQEIATLLTPYYRCKLYNQSEKNFLQADKEGCPLKIVLGSNELKNREIVLIRRDDIEQRILIKLEAETDLEKKLFPLHEDFAEKINKLIFPNHSSTQLAKEKTKMMSQIQKGAWGGRLFRAINQEVEKFSQSIYQKSVDFRDSHIYKVDSLTELKKKIKEGSIGLFLVPFCQSLECEKKIKKQVPAYSIRCVAEKEKINQEENCLFCFQRAKIMVYLGRSY